MLHTKIGLTIAGMLDILEISSFEITLFVLENELWEEHFESLLGLIYTGVIITPTNLLSVSD